jgi:hypothetical protein
MENNKYNLLKAIAKQVCVKDNRFYFWGLSFKLLVFKLNCYKNKEIYLFLNKSLYKVIYYILIKSLKLQLLTVFKAFT